MSLVPTVTSETCARCEVSCAQVLRRRTIRNGSVQFVYQCSNCGAASRNPVARINVRAPDSLPAFDDSIAERHELEALNERAADRQAWFAEHDAYLRTPEWKERRRLVMERANGICEGCRKAKAVHVHHLTYAHWKRELLWELVAVCVPCHEAAHDEGGK